MFVLIYHMHMYWRGKTDFPRKIGLEAAQLGVGADGRAHPWHSGTVSDTLQASVVVLWCCGAAANVASNGLLC